MSRERSQTNSSSSFIPPPWLQCIDKQLEEQYQRIEAPFEAIFHAYNESLRREEAVNDEQSSLEEQLKRLQNNLNITMAELEQQRNAGTIITDSKKYHELDAKYRQLKQDRIELMQTQSRNSSKLLELTDQVKKQDILKEQFEVEREKFIKHSKETSDKMEYFTSLMEEKNMHVQILQDELQAIQLELLQTDERVKALEKENSQLVDRWLNKVNETVDKLNSEVEQSESVISRGSIDQSSNDNILKKSRSSIRVKLSMKQPVFGLVTSPCDDFVLPLMASDINGHLSLLRNMESSSFLTSPTPIEPKNATFSRDSTHCIMVGDRNADTAHVWNLQSGKISATLSGGIGNAFIDFCPISTSNEAIVTLNSQNCIRFYDLTRNFCLWSESLDCPAKQITTLKTPHGDLVATLNQKGQVHLWDIRQRKVARKSSLQLSPIFTMASDFMGEDLVVCTAKGVCVVDYGTLMVLRTITHPNMTFPATGNPYLAISHKDSGKFTVAIKSKIFFGDYKDSSIEGILSDHQFNLAGVGWIKDKNSNASLLVSADVGGNLILRDIL